MFCPECGYPLDDDASKCEYCGYVFRSTILTEEAGDKKGVSDSKKKVSDVGSGSDGNSNAGYEKSVSSAKSKNISGGSNGKKPGGAGILKIMIGIAVLIVIVGILNIFVKYITTDDSHGNLKTSSSSSQNDTAISESGETVESTEAAEYNEIQNPDVSAMASESTPTPLPTPTPTPYPLSAIESHVTDKEPDDIGEYKRPSFTSAEATSHLVQQAHPEYDNSARSLIDGNYITSWQDGRKNEDGSGQQITISFDEEHLIHYIEFKLGNWRTQEYYVKNNRPMQMTLSIDGTEFTLDFTDAMISHYAEFDHPVKARTLNFTINSVYKGTEANDCCIAEITAYTE